MTLAGSMLTCEERVDLRGDSHYSFATAICQKEADRHVLPELSENSKIGI